MDRKKILKYLVFLMFSIFILDAIGQKFFWYYTIWWFDIVMHTISGFWVGLFFIYFFSRNNLQFPSILKVIIWVAVVGILWEFFELIVHNYIGRDLFDLIDTLSDLLCDYIGGTLAILYFSKKLFKSVELGYN